MRATHWRAARRVTAVGVLGLAVGLLPVGAVAAPTAVPAAPAPVTASTAARAVTLPSGDRLTVRTDPSGRLLISPARAGTPLMIRQVNGDVYAFPPAAQHRPGFDLARYDVSALVRGDTTAPPTAHPDYPMRTVTLNATDDQGNPMVSALLGVTNDDDTHLYDGVATVVNGVARISAPDGHYTALLNDDVFDATGQLVAEKVAIVDFTVAGAATTVTLDARTATHRVSVSTPKPADLVGQDFSWYRGYADEPQLPRRLPVGRAGQRRVLPQRQPGRGRCAALLRARPVRLPGRYRPAVHLRRRVPDRRRDHR